MFCRRLVNSIGRNNTRTLIRIAGRPKLPGSAGKGFPEYLNEATETFPYRIRAQDYDITEESSPEKCAEAVSKTYKKLLCEHGAVLLQGLPLGEPNKYNAFLNHLEGVNQMFYSQAGGLRHAVEERIYAASDYSNDASIEPHNEMSAAPEHPKIVSFACKQAGIGGESVLVDSFAWCDKIDRSVVDEFDQKRGVMYHQYLKENNESFNGKQLGADVSWKYVFQTNNKAEVEKQLRTHEKQFMWHKDNSLECWFSKPATIKHHTTGTRSWFNQSTMHHATFYSEMYPDTWGTSGIPFKRFPFHTYYGDGSKISMDVIQHIRNVAWNVAVGFQMHPNDVVMIDNERFAHARLDYKGERKLFAALLSDTDSGMIRNPISPGIDLQNHQFW